MNKLNKVCKVVAWQKILHAQIHCILVLKNDSDNLINWHKSAFLFFYLAGRGLYSLTKSKQFCGYKSVHVIRAFARFSLIEQRYIVVK
jgi:hypothetical protein